ncbi:NAD(P)-binding protein [Gymnopus androsaceus JB14]|uniref:NAD(P)-binding protein n=1 Tax=Gymnopus androsaceus JB14 TaxID=1447944 RepID=A0A6A4HQY0_9AGAR|nr:NAD(P)-binding protein [Gymnopus androsaceus JB14]
MSGKVVIITGSSGIGLASLQHLCRMGAKVYMTTPDEDRTREALKRVEREGREPGLGEVIWHELDLSDPRSAKTSAERFLTKETRLDILINNAALITDLGRPQLNADGLQDNMAINYLGPYVFTRTLLPLLEATATNGSDVRIVNVGSDGHKSVSYVDYCSKEAWSYKFRWSLLPALERYKYSKLAVHLWTNDLAKRLTAVKSGITLLIVHPGAIISDGAIRSLNTLTFPRFWIFIMGLMMHPQTMGAYTSVFAACSPKDNPHVFHGAYICPPNVSVPQGPNALNELKQRELAEFTERLLREIGI